ncbi:MAG: hypothetical protein IV090_25590 [Candidatus Sericytochromatia bacterium]|nr:hypothetical protein [Candidatus Sericytochromatia bacterium]
MKLNNWGFVQIRVTAFFAAGESFFPEPNSAFFLFTNKAPSNTQGKPIMGFYEQEGELNDANLKIIIRKDRVDILVLPLINEEDVLMSSNEIYLPNICKNDEVEAKFINPILSFFRDRPQVKIERLALGIKLRKEFDSVSSLYKYYSTLLPFKINPDTDSDVTLNINRPQTFENIKYNAIIKMSAEKIIVDQSIDGNPDHLLQTFLLHQEYDINSIPSIELNQELFKSKSINYSDLLDEFFKFTQRKVDSPFCDFKE